jgi:WD40 repeat protein
MKTGLTTILSVVILALVLAACDGANTAQPSAAGTTPANANSAGTPSAQQRPFAQGTRPANFTPGAQRTPQAASTNAPNSAATPAPTTNSAASTAVPVPTIVIPTPMPPSSSSNTNTSTAPANVPAASAPQTNAQPLPTLASGPSLASLRGKIIFFSDRDGGYPQLYMMNADGSDQQLCNCSDLLQTIVNNEVTSPDKNQSLYVKAVGGLRNADNQIWAHNNATNADALITGAAPGFPGVDYDPVWSPDSKHIAWVSEANRNDEIYMYDSSTNENVRLTQSNGEWYKHPSFSSDGSQIVYWSNVSNATSKQIWVMNLDGSHARNLSNNQYNDWDPIWVK